MTKLGQRQGELQQANVGPACWLRSLAPRTASKASSSGLLGTISFNPLHPMQDGRLQPAATDAGEECQTSALRLAGLLA